MTRRTDARRSPTPGSDFKVADLSLADFGRKEIQLAEHEMPGLMAAARRVRRQPAAGRRPHHRLAAHDHPDRGAHRDARPRSAPRCAGRQLQHLLHPGPRRRRRRRRPRRHRRRPQGRPGLRLEGRDARGVLVVHRAGAALARRRRPQHDPRRRRRRHAARPQGRRVRARRRGARARPTADSEEWTVVLGAAAAHRSPRTPSSGTGIGRGHQGRHRGDHHRRPPPLPDAGGRARCCSRPSTSTTRSPSRSSTTSTAAATRSSTASTAPPT